MEASSLLRSTSPSSTLESLSSTIQSNDNQSTFTSDTTADVAVTHTATGLEKNSYQQSVTISENVNELPSLETSNQTDEQVLRSDHLDSSIKLKRCKHGRIIIKDLSKKKLAQQSDIGENPSTKKQSDESNNNHIDSGSASMDENGTRNESNQSSNFKRAAPHEHASNHEGAETESAIVLSKLQPHTPPSRSDELSPQTKPDIQISSKETLEKRGSTQRLTLRARARSRSSDGSLSPARIIRNSKSPTRRSRYSRSPRRDRNYSRDHIRRQSSRRRYDSPSPRRRDRSPPSRRNRRARKRSSSRHLRRTPDLPRRQDIQKNQRSSPSRRSPHRKLPKSRSITPPRARSSSRRRNRNNESRTSSSRYDGYSQMRAREHYDKSLPLRSPDDHKSRNDAIEYAGKEDYISVTRNNHDNQSAATYTVAQSGTKSSLAQVINTHQSPQKHSPDIAQVAETSLEGSPLAPSPATPPSNESATSDIYDPEGPIIPISPCDSPPISPLPNIETDKPKIRSENNEKNGEDDVPSSAVQLNQQEKYLQKLNRQERVIEEVKVALRPFYQNRSISKEQYKAVLRKAVPKICHSKNGEINPIKIRALVDAYVKKMKR